MSLCGSAKTSCCWFDGKLCRFLEESDNEDFKWSCGLRRELGSWDKVHQDPRYIEFVKPKWGGLPYVGIKCGDWPPKGMKCNDCGSGG